MANTSIVFIFVDGVGLALSSSNNPFSSAEAPTLAALLGGPLTSERVQQGHNLLLRGIDATLGVPGLPQSGTGQAALLTGVNAAALVGHHQPHLPPLALHPLLEEQSIFSQVSPAAGTVSFANAFSPGYWQALARRRIRRSATVIAAEGAGLTLCNIDDLRADRALSWDITGEALREREGDDLPLRTPPEAGAVLAALDRDHALVFFECFLPDLVGHGRHPLSDEATVSRLDGLLAGLIDALGPGSTLLLTSDHGNIEDRSTPVHTRNPVPLLAVGPAADRFAAVEDIAGVAPVILDVLGRRA